MPRIDPVKLLSCIGVLLSPNGGIRSATEVKRLAGLMSKYSKKLVSKCIYIQILKCTETELLGQFMTVGGWSLVHGWLLDGVESKNWPLVQELLELLLLCPVDVPRLQSNSAPKLVKGLSREEENEGVRILATRLVEQWLKIARGEISSQNSNVFNKENLLDPQGQIIVKPIQMFSDQSLDNADNLNTVDDSLCVSQINDNDVTDCANDIDEPIEGLIFKITMKDGKQTLAKISDTSPKKNGNRLIDSHKDSDSEERISKLRDKSKDDKKSDGKDRDKSKDHLDKHKKSSSSSSHRSSSGSKSSSKHNSSSSSSKSSSSHNKSHKSNSSSSSGHKSSSSSSSSRDKDKHKSSSSKSSSSGSNSKDKKSESSKTQAEKDKDTLAKIQPKALEKVGKIPKKTTTDGSTDPTKKTTDAATVPPKKKSISIEIRKDIENRPKTVKTYNSQFRSHGLAEEAPPPPSRRDLKKPATVPTNGIPVIPKRSLSPINTAKEIDKKIKISLSSPTIEKPGAIKLIPAKPKPSVLVESDMFMDAISAATTKKEVRKRKRIPSAKESEAAIEKSPTSKDSKESIKSVTVAPMRFYQDTLEENDVKDESLKSDIIKKEIDAETDDGESKEKKLKIEDDSNDEPNDDKSADATTESDEPLEEPVKREPGPGCGPDGPPGVLTIHRRKGPKKSLRWRPQEQLEEVRYFELDENERVNVTKAFVDMKQMERVSEREAFLISRKTTTEDVMTEQIPWAALILVDDVPEYTVKSNEKDLQTEREKTCLKTIYFNRAMIPDSPHEPDVIAFQNIEPQTIPLFDITGNSDTIHDYTNMPWPEAKGSPPHQAGNLEEINGIPNFSAFGQFNSMNWPTQNNIIGIRPPPQLGQLVMPPDAINAMNINPMHAFNAPNLPPIMGQLPPNNMAFINNFAQGMPPIINNNQNNRGNNWFVGGNQNNPANNNWQPQGQNNNNNGNQRNNWIQNRRICKQFQRGFCRHGKSCKFLHPGENGPKF